MQDTYLLLVELFYVVSVSSYQNVLCFAITNNILCNLLSV